MGSATLQLASDLIARASVTPDDAGCQAMLIERLGAIGFECETMQFDDVTNLWARRGQERPLLAFAGHTDVVPPGPLEKWYSDPFVPEIRDGVLYGRGAADMKSSIAAMVTACERFVQQHPDHFGSIALLITSDEEGKAVNGTVRVIETLEARTEKIDWALIGEPSSHDRVGDVCKNGRRGSIGARLTIHGVQGHVAYPHKVDNPIHRAMPALHDLARHQWDQGNQFFPPTSLQISNINAGTGAHNVVPGHAEVLFNLRYSTEIDAGQIKETTRVILDKHELDYDIEWSISGYPFLTAEGELLRAAEQAIRQHTGLVTDLQTTGGTSDGRFIAPTGAQVLELGPVNDSIHKINEHVNVAELDTLSDIYQSILQTLLS
ncbi:MAG: succinyl-diaminopimelate desuccinylase [Gammaproteobacteria bacterium]|nr:MAG: succinyl-diaminopimelate desuccinylase [Gammaproteobacteria bacterium]UCH41548.1 MAG: succinyl-diaminopimelate desuccinylase [Gammaproteobacteria bacterium]